jgi:hypothetical protein
MHLKKNSISGCGGIGIRARLRCVWHCVLGSSSLPIRINLERVPLVGTLSGKWLVGIADVRSSCGRVPRPSNEPKQKDDFPLHETADSLKPKASNWV